MVYDEINILDCDVNTVGKVGKPPAVISSHSEWWGYTHIICISAEGSKAVAIPAWNSSCYSDPFALIDLQKGEVPAFFVSR